MFLKLKVKANWW